MSAAATAAMASRVVQYVSVAGAAAYFYDYMLTLNTEVSTTTNQSWSVIAHLHAAATVVLADRRRLDHPDGLHSG